MVQQTTSRRTIGTGLVLATLLAVSLTACGTSGSSVGDVTPAGFSPGNSSNPGGNPISQNPPAPVVEMLPGPANPPAGDSGGVDTPGMIGATPQPKGASTMSVSVIATTSSYYPLDNNWINTANPIGTWINNLLQPYAKYTDNRITVITAKIMWLPIQGAAKYRVIRFADNDPQSHTLFYQVPDNKFMRQVSGYFFAIDGVLPVDTLSLGPNNGLHPYTNYHYVVQAYDASGTLITQNDPTDAAAATTPLPEIANPQVSSPVSNASVTQLDPLFTWYTRALDPTVYGYQQGLNPDGFIIEVSLQGIPIWETYKDGPTSTIIRYGQKLGWHPLLNPISQLVTVPLSGGHTYSWALTSIKADSSHHAIAKSSSQAGIFTVSANAQYSTLPGLTGGSSTSSTYSNTYPSGSSSTYSNTYPSSSSSTYSNTYPSSSSSTYSNTYPSSSSSTYPTPYPSSSSPDPNSSSTYSTGSSSSSSNTIY